MGTSEELWKIDYNDKPQAGVRWTEKHIFDPAKKHSIEQIWVEEHSEESSYRNDIDYPFLVFLDASYETNLAHEEKRIKYFKKIALGYLDIPHHIHREYSGAFFGFNHLDTALDFTHQIKEKMENGEI